MKLSVAVVAILMGGFAMAITNANSNPELLAISLIAKYEGFRETVYTCAGGKATIGYGFTDPKVVAKKKITRAEADRILGKMVREELVFINKRLPGLTPKQQAAVVSFIHNFGRTKFVESTYYKKLKEKDFAAAQRELMKWVNVKQVNKKTGKVELVKLNGLVKRRASESSWLS